MEVKILFNMKIHKQIKELNVNSNLKIRKQTKEVMKLLIYRSIFLRIVNKHHILFLFLGQKISILNCNCNFPSSKYNYLKYSNG